MGNGVAAAMKLSEGEPRGIGGDELARGLMLVRSSAMKLARLHLAMERQDRRLVLETMDDLAAIDRQIQDFVDEIPTSDSGIAALQDELEQQKLALAREKLALAAGIIRRDQPQPNAKPSAALGDEVPAEAEVYSTSPHAPLPIRADHPVQEEWVAAWEEEAPRSRTGFIMTLIALLMVAGLGALFMTGAGQELVGRLLQTVGA
jgi:hypothetical protein